MFHNTLILRGPHYHPPFIAHSLIKSTCPSTRHDQHRSTASSWVAINMCLFLQLIDNPSLHFACIADILVMKDLKLPRNMEKLPPFIAPLKEDFISRFAGLLSSQINREAHLQIVKEVSAPSWIAQDQAFPSQLSLGSGIFSFSHSESTQWPSLDIQEKDSMASSKDIQEIKSTLVDL